MASVRRIASLTLVGSTKKRSKRHTDRLVGCRISSRAVGSKVNTLASRGHAFGSYAAAASADASRMGLCWIPGRVGTSLISRDTNRRWNGSAIRPVLSSPAAVLVIRVVTRAVQRVNVGVSLKSLLRKGGSGDVFFRRSGGEPSEILRSIRKAVVQPSAKTAWRPVMKMFHVCLALSWR